MAHIKLLDPFKKELRDMVVYTLAEFGATSVKRFNKELDDIKHRLILHPLSSPREPLLKRFHRPYHSAIIKENWKIIYRYDEANDLVIFVDLWDMRRSPRYLIRQFKRKLQRKKLMKEKRYTLQEEQPTPIGWHPANEEEAVARIEAIEEEYENGQYIDAEEFEKELTAQYPWLEDWKRSISIEDFRKNCKKKLKSLFLTKNGI